MKKLKQVLGKRVFEKRSGKEGSPRPPAFRGTTLGEFLDVFHFVGRSEEDTFAPAARRGRRISARPVSVFNIGGLHPRARCQFGRSMIEMLAVLAIIGVLSVAALAGFTYAMNKHRANTIYNDVHLLALHVMDTGKDTVPADFYSDSGKTYSLDTTTYADGFVVKVSDVSEKVCDRIMEVKDPSIEKIYVGSEETTTCSGSQTMGFMFLYDGVLTSGGSSGGSGSGTDPDPVDPCEEIIASTDCSLSADVTDSNGCVTVKKITCTGDTYCSVSTCEPCPDAETCDGESCCALTGPEDICGHPTKEVGTVTTVTHSDVNANGCCEKTTQESCSLNPITPRMCTATCDGTCQSDGSCQKVCEANTYGSDCLPCGSGAVSDGTTATCVCDTENGFTGTWTAPATGSDDNGCAQGSTCTSNANCKSGYFCAFQNPSGCSNAGSGQCKAVSQYGPYSTHVEGFIMSTSTMTWWSAQNWCSAQNKTPATRESIGCNGIMKDYCRDSDLLTSFVYTWTNGYIWLEDYGNSCNAYYMYLGYSSSERAYISYGSAATGWSGYTYALCY